MRALMPRNCWSVLFSEPRSMERADLLRFDPLALVIRGSPVWPCPTTHDPCVPTCSSHAQGHSSHLFQGESMFEFK